MSSRRTMILIAAVVVGALSAFFVFSYVNGADDRAQGNAAQVKVLLVKKDIPRGMSGRDALTGGYIAEDKIQTKFRPATAIIDRAQLDNANVAIANLPSGQVIVQNMFADAESAAATYAEAVPKECGQNNEPCVAIAITVDSVRGVAGVIAPGDFVNILVLPKGDFCAAPGEPPVPGKPAVGGAEPGVGAALPSKDEWTPDPGGVVACAPARVLYQAVRVLFVDRIRTGDVQTASAANGSANTATNTGLITLAVPAPAAQLIASVEPQQLYLNLLPPSYAPQSLPPLDPYMATLPGEDANLLTPYGPNGIQKK